MIQPRIHRADLESWRKMKLSNSKEAGLGHDEEIFSTTEVKNSDNIDPAGFKIVTEL